MDLGVGSGVWCGCFMIMPFGFFFPRGDFLMSVENGVWWVGWSGKLVGSLVGESTCLEEGFAFEGGGA